MLTVYCNALAWLSSRAPVAFLLSDGGRVCRPLLVVENGRTRLTKTHLDQMALAVLSLQGKPTNDVSSSFYGWTKVCILLLRVCLQQ